MVDGEKDDFWRYTVIFVFSVPLKRVGAQGDGAVADTYSDAEGRTGCGLGVILTRLTESGYVAANLPLELLENKFREFFFGSLVYCGCDLAEVFTILLSIFRGNRYASVSQEKVVSFE